ncbi:hypothetical protein BGZ95_006614, partial [Linnemannia exigua]
MPSLDRVILEGSTKKLLPNGTAVMVDAHQPEQRQLFRVCTSNPENKNATDASNSPAAINLSHRPFREDAAIQAAPEHAALPYSPLIAVLAHVSPLPLNTQSAEALLVNGGDERDMGSSSFEGPPSLLLCQEYPQGSTPPLCALHHPPGLLLPSSPSGVNNNGSLSSVVTSSSQDYLHESHDADVANGRDQFAFSAIDWTLYSASTETSQSPDLTSTSYPSLFTNYADTPAFSPPTNSHPGDQTPMAKPFSLASTPSLTFQAASTIDAPIGVQSLVAVQAIDHISAPDQVIAEPMTEYTHSRPNRGIFTLDNALSQSILPSNTLPCPQVFHHNGSGYHPSPLDSSMMNTQYPTQLAPWAVGPFSTPDPLATGSSSRGHSVPIQPNYDPMLTSNSVFSPSPMNLDGYSSTTTRSGCKNHAQFPCPCDVNLQNRLVDVSTRLADATLEGLGHSFAKTQKPQTEPYFNICSNCETTESPSWRRCRKSMILLCNACGLYLKQHSKPRPVFKTKDGTIRILRGTTEHEPCTICKATQSAFWRKNTDNVWICNACYQIARQSASLACEATMATTAVVTAMSTDASSSVVATPSRPISTLPSPEPSALPCLENNNTTTPTPTNSGRKGIRANSAAASLPRSGASPSAHQEQVARSASSLQPDFLEEEQPYRARLRSFTRRSSYPLSHQPQQKRSATSRGAATPMIQGETVVARVATKINSRKRQACRKSPYGTAPVNAESSVSTPISIVDHTTNSGQSLGQPSTPGDDQGCSGV